MARRLHRVPAYSTKEEAVAPVDAVPSYLTRMAFRSTLSGDGPDIARGFLFPGATVSHGTQQQSLDPILEQIQRLAHSIVQRGNRGRFNYPLEKPVSGAVLLDLDCRGHRREPACELALQFHFCYS